jgi:aspartyl-tRNA(Asn)/glutamyl-tRNA(Gln) amidotransferase subunit A
VQAQRRRREVIAAVENVFRDVDVLLTANAMDPACRIDDEETIARTYPRQARGPFNLTGHPAIALPAGFSKAGLPISIQLVGRYFDEATLFRAANGYERAAGHAAHRPRL